MKRKLFHVVFGLICCAMIIGFVGCEGVISPPLTITFRESMINSTRVLQLTNRSGQETLVISVLAIDGRNENKRYRYTVKVGPGDTEEVGYFQAGFNFDKGDRVEVACDGYIRTLTAVVP